MPKLPKEIDLTVEKDFHIPDEFFDAINEFLAEKYGFCTKAYGVEIKAVEIEWDEED